MVDARASIERVLCMESDAVRSLTESLDYAAANEVLRILCNVKNSGHKVITAGCGTSGAAAKKIAHTLNVVEIPAFFCAPGDSVHGGMGAIQDGDVVILISKGGNSKEILNYLPVCKVKGARIIGVTENENSTLAKNCDVLLKVCVSREPDRWGYVATSSTMAVIAVFDALAITSIDYTGFSSHQFLLIHPGGAVGEKLSHQ